MNDLSTNQPIRQLTDEQVERPREAFLRIFRSMIHRHRPHRLWEDFVGMASIALQNHVVFDDEREARYMDMVGRHQGEEPTLISQLMALTAIALQRQKQDFLGSLYMELELGNRATGQFFTPYHLSLLMAEINAQGAKECIERKGHTSVSDPACGAGCTLIAFAQALEEQGLNPGDCFYHAIDVDASTARMCYIQLALLGLPAAVYIGNTLSMEMREVMLTPAYAAGGWHMRLRDHEYRSPELRAGEMALAAAVASVNEALPEIGDLSKQKGEAEAPAPTTTMLVASDMQLSLF